MKVGMPTTSFPKHPADPSGAFVLGMARALAARGHDVEVLAPAPAGGAAPWTAPAPGVRVTWVRYAWPRGLQRTFHGAGAPETLARDPLAWPGTALYPGALAHAVHSRGRRWDALVSHWGVPCGIVGSALAQGRPHVAFFHSGDVHVLSRLPRPLGARLARVIARGATTLAFVSEVLRQAFFGLLEGTPKGATPRRTRSCSPWAWTCPRPARATPHGSSSESMASWCSRCRVSCRSRGSTG